MSVGRGAMVWLWLIGAAMAAEVATAPVVVPRTVEGLPALAWWFLIGWSFAGWMSASLKPAVIAMHDTTQQRAVALAGIVSTLVSSMAFGIGVGLYLLCEARWDDKPLAALYGYLGALAGGFWGMKGMEFGIDVFKGIVERWAQKGIKEDGKPS